MAAIVVGLFAAAIGVVGVNILKVVAVVVGLFVVEVVVVAAVKVLHVVMLARTLR